MKWVVQMPDETKKEPPKLREVKLESGIEVKPIYTPEDVKDIDYTRDIGNPGEYPFTRGIHKYMYRLRPYTMRQYSGFATAKESNQRFKYLIEHGQTGLNVAFDLPTQLGLSSDDPRAAGEVGRVGMAIDSLADMEDAFEDIAIDKINGVDHDGYVFRDRKKARCTTIRAARERTKRYPKRVRWPRHLDLPGGAVYSVDQRYNRVLC